MNSTDTSSERSPRTTVTRTSSVRTTAARNRARHRKPTSAYARTRQKAQSDMPSSLNIKLFVSLSILLVVLLMKKYDLSIGSFNIDNIYQVVYYQEDFTELKDKIFVFSTGGPKAADTPQDTNVTDTNVTPGGVEVLDTVQD